MAFKLGISLFQTLPSNRDNRTTLSNYKQAVERGIMSNAIAVYTLKILH